MALIYTIGSLRNPAMPVVATALRKEGFEVFDDWFAAGPIADDSWQEYEKAKGISYPEALRSYAAQHVFEFDKHHLNRADIALLVLPAGKSGHIELGYMIGLGKPGYVLFDKEPDRWDVMYAFTKNIFFNVDDLVAELKRDYGTKL